MASKGKPSARLEFNSFIQGLITEANPLNFPPNASLDEENFELNRTGSRFRRRGMTLEEDYSSFLTPLSVSDLQKQVPSTFKWLGVGGSADRNYVVVRIGSRLSLFDLNITPLSAQIPVLIDVTFHAASTYSFAAVDGRLVIAAGESYIAIVTYDGGLFNVEYRRLLTRDVWGVEETSVVGYETDVAFRSAVTSDQHNYNLQNQSWGIPRIEHPSGLGVDPITKYRNDLGLYPSNSESVWIGMSFSPGISGGPPFERIYTNRFDEVIGAELNTARGYYIVDVLDRGTSRQDNVANNFVKYPNLDISSLTLPVDTTVGGATVVGEFAGRVFYGGFDGEVVGGDKRSPNLSNLIFFSQLVKSLPDVTKCYQEGDPTSRESSDIVDTDGGFIRIAGMSGLVKLVNLASSLIVIATNGVWAVTGGSDYGFSATNFKVEKISTYGGLSATSVVEFAGRVMYWGEDGIYLIGKDQFGTFVVTSATETTIQTYYESLDNTVKYKAVGCYDSIGKKLRWFYNTGDKFSIGSDQRELVFDLVLNAFVKNKIYNSENNRYEIFGLFSDIALKTSDSTEDVTVGFDDVFVGIDRVVVPFSGLASSLQATRYLVVFERFGFMSYSFGYYRDLTFTDWGDTEDTGTDAFAYLLTGALTAGDSALAKQTPYLTLHMYRTEDGVDADLVPIHQSSCRFRGQWDFSNSANSNKWSAMQEGYRYRRQYLAGSPSDPYDTGFELITTKNKLRGRGKSFSLYLSSSPLKDCKIVGWNLNIDANFN